MARYIDFMDMIDGGGAGKMGNEFEGGGLLSALANAFATPYGSEDEERRKRLMQSRGLLSDQGQAGGGSFAPASDIIPNTRPRPRPANLDIPLDAFGGAGPNVTGAAAERGMGLDPFGGAGRGVAPNPLANMPATDAMAMMRNASNQQPVPFGGFQQPTPYTDMMDRMREMGIDVNSMSVEQLQNLMTLYMRGGPMNYRMGR